MSFQRWKEDLIELGRLGRRIPARIDAYGQLAPEKGLFRLEGTEEMRQSKEYVMARMREAGLKVRIDKVGNIFARKEGSKINRGAVMSGSHLDSVLNGGMFDGPLGVISALEAVRIMNDEALENERPIEVVIFTGEEGSAFKKALLGSLILVGKMPVEEAWKLENNEGLTLKAALDRFGLRGDFEMDLSEVEYFIETHVEQGPILDQEKIPIGIVENITGLTWVSAILEGEENHAGTTPMFARKDALVAAAKIVLFANRRAQEMVRELGGSTVATVGRMSVLPGAPNIVPGRVEMGIDIRDGIEEHMKNLMDEITGRMKDLEAECGVKTSITVPFYHLPHPCSKVVVDTIEKAVQGMGIQARRMNSGAGHDAQNIAEKVKTGMIFVPSVKGISHSPMEWTNWEDVERGIMVLTRALKDLSKLRI
jgi:N-carbamoyl-L-amino-acid hydrolase